MDSEEIDKWNEESERAWKEDNHDVSFSDSIVLLLNEILPAGAHILDAGCGIGKHIKAFRNLGYNAEGTDQSLVAIRYARKLNPYALVNNLRLQELNRLPRGSYDLVHTCAVLQHSTHARKIPILHNFRYILKPKGYYLCAECTLTPETLKLLKEKNPAAEFTEDWTDGYSFSLPKWLEFMRHNGFNHLKTIGPWPYYLFVVRE